MFRSDFQAKKRSLLVFPFFQHKFHYIAMEHFNESFGTDNHPIFDTIDNAYIQEPSPFIRAHYSNNRVHCSRSTISLAEVLETKSLYRARTQRGEPCVRISRNHWLYVQCTNLQEISNVVQKPPTVQASKQSQKTVQSEDESKVESSEDQSLVQIRFCQPQAQPICGHKKYIYNFDDFILNNSRRCSLVLVEASCKDRLSTNSSENSAEDIVGQDLNSYLGLIVVSGSESQDWTGSSKLVQIKDDEAFNQGDRTRSSLFRPRIFSLEGLLYLGGFRCQNAAIKLPFGLKEILLKEIGHVSARLSLGNENVGVEGVEYIGKTKSRNLESLNLWWNMLGEEGAKELSRQTFESLTLLDLRKNFIGDKGFGYLCTKKTNDEKRADQISLSFPNLQNLILTDNNLTEIAKITHQLFPSLRNLQLQNNKITLNNSKLLTIPALHSLRFLSLRNNLISGEGLDTLNLMNIEVLYLNDNKIQSCESLSGANLPNLRVLNLSKNRITSIRSARKWSLFHENNKLETIDLTSNFISEFQVLQSVRLTSLSELRLQNPNRKVGIVKQPDRINNINVLSKFEIASKSEDRLIIGTDDHVFQKFRLGIGLASLSATQVLTHVVLRKMLYPKVFGQIFY